jgi:hypothetical protein
MKPELGPEYLHAEDLLKDGKWTEATVVIESVLPPNTVKSADGTLITKPVVCFEKTNKRLVLGSDNGRLMICEQGTNKIQDWTGKPVTLYAAAGNWFGQKNVAAIRVRVGNGKAMPFLKLANLGRDLTGTMQGNQPAKDGK